MFLKARGARVALAIACTGVVASFLSSAPDDVRHQDLYDYAREQRSDLIAATHDIARALEEESLALSGLFPTIRMTAFTVRQGGVEWPPKIVEFALGMSIYEPAGPFPQYWLAQTRTKLMRYNRDNLLNTIRYQVGQSYFDYHNVLSNLAFNRALDDSSRLRFDKAELDCTQGMISDVDFEQEKAVFANSQSMVKSFKNYLSIAREGLILSTERHIAGDSGTELDNHRVYRKLVDRGLVLGMDQFVREALAKRQELRAIDQRIEAAEVEKDIARYSYVPTIRFINKMHRIWPPEIISLELRPYEFGLEFHWDLDLGNVFKFRRAEVERLKAIFERKRMEVTIENEVRTNYERFEVLKKDLVAAKARVEDARIIFERNKRAHELGLISDLEFKAAQTDWEKARVDLQMSLTNTGQQHEQLLWSSWYPEEQRSCFEPVAEKKP
ncbi:MAG: TolC family protein [Candidatus Dependentiae bacterium]|nr:TolC family protein [Candidatus Dependentiae bacterium]